MDATATGALPESVLTQEQLARYANVLSGAVLLIGCLVMVGWVFDVEVLKSIVRGRVTMKFNTAMGLSLAALSLQGAIRGRARPWRIASSVCGVVIVLLGVVTLAEYAFGLTTGLDQLLISEETGAAATTHPGRMSPQTAASFLMFGTATLLSTGQRARWLSMSAALLGLAAVVALAALAGHLYGAVYLYGISQFTGMALHTAVAFLLLYAGLFCAQQRHGAPSVYFRDSLGGMTARRLLPIAVLLPLLLGWLFVVGRRSGLYDTAAGEALLIVATIVSFATLIDLTARRFDAIDAARREATMARERIITDLQRALSEIHTLRGLLPMCAWCHRIRNDSGYWENVAKYVADHTEAVITHGICPDCAHKHFP